MMGLAVQADDKILVTYTTDSNEVKTVRPVSLDSMLHFLLLTLLYIELSGGVRYRLVGRGPQRRHWRHQSRRSWSQDRP